MAGNNDELVGKIAPNFNLISDQENEIELHSLSGKKIILYFYPKDLTSGCTQQACSFRDFLNSCSFPNLIILGISKDSVQTHKKFKNKHELNFPLLSDINGTTCEKYKVWKEKSMYGKKYFGIERSTFLINENLEISHIWRKVKVHDHVEQLTEALERQKNTEKFFIKVVS